MCKRKCACEQRGEMPRWCNIRGAKLDKKTVENVRTRGDKKQELTKGYNR